MQFLNAYGQAEFKGHIEAWRPRCPGVQLHTGKIVNRVTATADQVKDLVESTLATGDVQCDARGQAQMDKPNNIGQVQTAKCVVVRNIQKNRIVVLLRQLSGHGFLSFLFCAW